MAWSKRARGYAIAIPLVTAFTVLYMTVPSFQTGTNMAFGWMKSFRQWWRDWLWIVLLGLAGLVGILYVLALAVQILVSGTVKREELRTGRKLSETRDEIEADRPLGERSPDLGCARNST